MCVYFITIYLFRYAKYERPLFQSLYRGADLFLQKCVRYQMVAYHLAILNNVVKALTHKHATIVGKALNIDRPAFPKHI